MLERFVKVKLWRDKPGVDTEAVLRLQKELSQQEGLPLPWYMLLTPDRKVIAQRGGRLSRDSFLQWLRQAVQ